MMEEKNHVQKEELLEKLSEIYEQLEELEKALDNNLTEHRNKLMTDQFAKLDRLDGRISKLERIYQNITFDKKRVGNLHQNTSMKLELGF